MSKFYRNKQIRGVVGSGEYYCGNKRRLLIGWENALRMA